MSGVAIYKHGITERPCVICKEVKPLDQFRPRADRPSGVRSRCIDCDNKASRDKRFVAYIKPQTKVCSNCRIKRDISEFSSRPDRQKTPYGYGVRSKCKGCVDKGFENYPSDAKAWRAKTLAADPQYDRRKNLKRNYNLTLEEYDELLDAQEGVCKICGGPPMGKGRYHVDHDHKTGKIRGLLCHKCNVALGMVQDSVELLSRLAEYVANFGELT